MYIIRKRKIALTTKQRLLELDGIRGWAAMVVLLYHLILEVFGQLFPVYNNLFFRAIFDGNLAVCIFFILSGDALSSSFISSGKFSVLARLIVKRYFRLAGPVLLATLIVYLLMSFNFVFNKEAGDIVLRPIWLGSQLNFEPNFEDAFKFGVRFVFTDFHFESSYNPYLWPMSIELLGSFVTFMYLAIYRNLKKPLMVVVFFAFIFLIARSYYSLFCIGIFFSHMRNQGFFNRVFESKYSRNLTLLGTLLLIFLLMINNSLSEKVFQSQVVLAGLIVFIIYSRKGYIQFFSNPISVYLGKISFPLYITHFAVIISFTSFFIKWLDAHRALNFTNSMFVILISALTAILLAHIFSKVEIIYLNFLNKMADLIVKI
jgi:peptidoglycan/LPS O-acetylase OafA/YrhL